MTVTWRLKCALCFFMGSLWIFMWDGLARGRSHRFTLCEDILRPSLRGKIHSQIKLHLGIRSTCGPFFSNDVYLVGCMRIGVGHTKAKSAMCYLPILCSQPNKKGRKTDPGQAWSTRPLMNEAVAIGWSHRLLAMFHMAVTKIPHRNYRGEGLT